MEVLEKIEVETPLLTKKFKDLNNNQFNIGKTTSSERIKKLKKFHKTLLRYRPQIKEALFKDYRKHPTEVDLSEIYPVVSEIKKAKRHLHQWMKNQHVSTPIALLGSSSFIKYEPKGVVLIISPWNFPFNLTFGPLIGAVAAGNTVMIKPSEYTPNASQLMGKIIKEVFDENEVTLIEGGVETSQELLKLPFNHIFFTGSPNVGKIVMKAASNHLASVTLELGGKSPTIVDETANLNSAARRIAWGKFINNGQVCIAPDYLFVHEKVKEQFLIKVKEYIDKFYSEDIKNEASYSRIVNHKHFNRVQSIIQDAIENGAEVEVGNNLEETQNFIPPTILSNISESSRIMQEEIFGPVLPLQTFTDLSSVVDKINSKEKPLALYIYSKSKKNIKYVLNNTRAGGGCINHNAVHFFNTNLPFGGSNNSGIGKGHGFESFKAFSNARGILKQHIPNALELLMPPYTNFKQKLVDITIKYF